MKKHHKNLLFKAVTVIFTAIAVIFLYGFLIGGASDVWFIVAEFSALFIVLCLMLKETDRKKLVNIFERNIVICLIVAFICTFAYDGINTLQVKETKTYYSTVTEHYGKGAGTVCFLDESGEEQCADLNDYSLVQDDGYFENGKKIIVTEKRGMFDTPFFSVEEVEE